MTWFRESTHTCPDGSQYDLEYESLPMRDKDSVSCPNCGEHLRRWNGGHQYRTTKVRGPTSKPSE